MANSCKSTIQIKRGEDKDLPVLKEGELGFSTDTKEVYIGQESGENLKLFPQEPAGAENYKEIIGAGYAGPTREFTNKKRLLTTVANSTRTNTKDYEDYFCLSTIPEVSEHPTVTIKQSGFYSFHFDISLSIPAPSEAGLSFLEVVGLTNFKSQTFTMSYIPLTHKMNIHPGDNNIYLEGGTIVYINVDKTSYPAGVPVYLLIGSTVPAAATELTLAKVQDFGFTINRVKEQLSDYEIIELK